MNQHATSASSVTAAALIPAAGSGSRLGLGPKAFLRLQGKTLLRLAVEKVQPLVQRIVVGVRAEHVALAQEEVGALAQVVIGGNTRVATLSAALAHCSEQVIVIVDAAAPFASSQLIRKVIEGAAEHGVAAAGSRPPVPVVRLVEGKGVDSIPRSQLRLVHTPNAFQRPLLVKLLELSQKAESDELGINDWAVRCGYRIQMVDDEPMNIKVTNEFDWLIAQKVIQVAGG